MPDSLTWTNTTLQSIRNRTEVLLLWPNRVRVRGYPNKENLNIVYIVSITLLGFAILIHHAP